MPGFELLVDYDVQREPDEWFAERDVRKGRHGERREDRPVQGRLYLALPTSSALRQLVRLWDRWVAGQELGPGLAPFKHLFAQLRNLRPWGPSDRIPEDTVEYWREEIARQPDRPVRTELELWFYRSSERRLKASRSIRQLLDTIGGVIISETQRVEVAYHAMLVDIPAVSLATLIARDEVALAIADDVMYLRPQMNLSVPQEIGEVATVDAVAAPVDGLGEPICALFDGVILQDHELLRDRTTIDDADDLEAMALVQRRVHGTAMASLIIHGDLNAATGSLRRRIYVRPIMVAPDDGPEHTPSTRLVVDLVYDAVLRMRGSGGRAGKASSVFLVNLSLGDRRRPFTTTVSPLARTLDFLAASLNILFVVSAGNIVDPLQLPEFENWTALANANDDARERAVIRAMFADKHKRSMLAPAEAINVLTIGAHHHDSVVDRGAPAMTVDPFADSSLPNPSCAIGLGYRRSAKPDLYLPGGRERLRMIAGGAGVTAGIASPQRAFGLSAASPDSANLGRLDQSSLVTGTSAATGLATRACHQVFDALMDRDGGSQFYDMPPEYYAVAIKTLMTHSACWTDGADRIKDVCGPAEPRLHVERSSNATRFLGLGIPDARRVLDCATNQATLLGYGTLAPDGAHNYRVPLPPSLEGVVDPRSLTVTVAWLSPIKPGHQSYRAARLEAAPTVPERAFGVKRFIRQPSDPVVRKGTVFHERFVGENAVPFLDDGHLSVRVWCMDDAGHDGTPIRYAIAVTLEAGTEIAIYDEVRARLLVPAVV